MTRKHVLVACFAFVLFGCSPSEKGVKDEISAQMIWVKLNVPKFNKDDYRFFKAGVWDGKEFILLTTHGSKLVSSPNGTEWSKYPVNADGDVSDMRYVHGRLFLKAGVWWRHLDEAGHWKPIVEKDTTAPLWDGKRYVCFSDRAKYESSDLNEWSETEITSFEDVPEDVVYGNGQFIAYVSYQRNFISKDGSNWKPLYTDSRTIYMMYWHGKLYGSADNVPTVRSYAGGEWTAMLRPKLGPAPENRGLTSLNGKLFAFGRHISWTTDGESWGSYVLPCCEEVEHVIAGNDRYLAIGSGDSLFIGANAIERTKLDSEIKRFNRLDNPFFQ